MRRVTTLMGRELRSYFLSPMAYILAALYMLVTNIFFHVKMSEMGMGDMPIGPRETMWELLGVSILIMLLVVPIVTMRLLAGEKDSGSMEILVTDPVTDWDIELGKYLAALFCVLAMLLPLGVYAAILAVFSRGPQGGADWGTVLSSLLGLVALMVLYTAVGIFASSLTRNQVVSVVIAVVALLVLWFAWMLRNSLSSPALVKMVDSFSLNGRVATFMQGRVETSSIFYFLSTAALLLYFTVRVTESRKWR